MAKDDQHHQDPGNLGSIDIGRPPAAETLTSDELSSTLSVVPVVQADVKPKRMQQAIDAKVNPWVHFVSGGIAGMAGALFTCPLDVVKTRLQSDFYREKVASSAKSSNIVSTALRHFRETGLILAEVYRIEGPRALFKGLGPNLVGVIPARSINFFSYGLGKDFLSKRFYDGEENSVVHLLAALHAGFWTSTATNPIWLVKTRLQLDKAGKKMYRGSWDCIKSVVKNEGIRGLYKGLSASYLGSAESTIQWVLYEQMKAALRRNEAMRKEKGIKPTTLDSFLDWGARSGAAGFAKLLASLITYPHEVVRTRLRQAPLENGRPKYHGLLQTFKLVVKEEGFASMYGGLTPHLLRTVPNSIIMFGTWELLVKLYASMRDGP